MFLIKKHYCISTEQHNSFAYHKSKQTVVRVPTFIMGKKIKSVPAHTPNAPEFHQILQPQPPHNPHFPFYPDPSAPLLTSPPPPYSELSVPMAQINSTSNISYPRIDPRGNPSRHHASVIIQSPGVPYDRRADKYNRRVRSFNNQTMIIAILAIVLSVWAYNLYDARHCLFDFTVVKPSKDVKLSVMDVRNMHLTVAVLSGFLVLISLAKSATGYNSKSYSCYLFIIGLFTFFVTLFTGYLAYLAFYSPCAPRVGELATNISRTLFGSISDSLPAPDKGLFGESNVLSVANEDRNGVLIFIFDLVNFIFYFAVFLTSTLLC